MKNKPALFIISFVLVLAGCLAFSTRSFAGASGCVYPEDVRRDYVHVNKADGVNEKEAGLIAQMEFLKRDVNNFFLKILNKIKVKDEHTWLVTFQAYHDGPESGQALDVCVDKVTGEITCWHKRPLVIKQGKQIGFGLFSVQETSAE